MLKNKYRLKRGYLFPIEAEVKYWWLPFVWVNIGFCLDEADGKRKIHHHKNPIVYQE